MHSSQDFVIVHNQHISKHCVLNASSIKKMISYSQCNEAKVSEVYKIMKGARASTHQLRNVMASSTTITTTTTAPSQYKALIHFIFDFYNKKGQIADQFLLN